MQLREIKNYAENPEQLLPRFTPEVHIFETPSEVDDFATTKFIEQIRIKPASVLTLPTGNTPVGMYTRIVEAYKQGIVDLQEVTIFNLDEYYPIAPNHPNSYASFMRNNLINHVRVSEWYIPNGHADNPDIEAVQYSRLMAQHQSIDLAVLGIGPGSTCHIGFNEKGSSIDSHTRYVPLHAETKHTNATLFDKPEEIPEGALTQGMAEILQAKQILVLAKGESKAWGINRTLKGPISAEAPASFLRLHPNVTFAIDQAAGQYL